MNFNKHSNLVGTHAFLSASNYAWIRYDEEKLERYFQTSLLARRGIELHELAHNLIRLGVKLPQSRNALNLYVNDAIGYRMTSEQILYYSDDCYGCADTIGFRNKFLRIHDYKSGDKEASPDQLKIYAALYCLEYKYSPFEIQIELRIYQSNEVRIYPGDPDEIIHIMDKITSFDKRIRALRLEARK